MVGLIERDPQMNTDRLTSAILDFPGRPADLSPAGTQLVPYQRMQIFGTRGRVEIEIPFNAPPDRPCRVLLDDGSDLFGSGIEIARNSGVRPVHHPGRPVLARRAAKTATSPCRSNRASANMAVIEAVFRSAESGKWEEPCV